MEEAEGVPFVLVSGGGGNKLMEQHRKSTSFQAYLNNCLELNSVKDNLFRNQRR